MKREIGGRCKKGVSVVRDKELVVSAGGGRSLAHTSWTRPTRLSGGTCRRCLTAEVGGNLDGVAEGDELFRLCWRALTRPEAL